MQEKIKKLKNLKLLFVDDEVSIQNALSNILNNLQVKFFIATNGEEALEILEKNKDINFVITDINMPKMNGLQLIEKIQNNYTDIKFIVLSAHSDAPYLERANKLNIKSYLVKPMDIIKLINTIVE